jgi:hypothetical protein
MSPSTDSERELAPVVAAANGSAPYDEDLSDATQEFHVEQSEDWLAAEEG